LPASLYVAIANIPNLQFVPITGQGGNSAIETAAALTNNLVQLLHQSPTRPSLSEISRVFETVQTLRMPRVQKLIKQAHQRQQREALAGPEIKTILADRVSRITLDTVYRDWSGMYSPGVSLDMLDVPVRPRTVPFDDEIRQGRRTANSTKERAML
jgi:hypothetical protein